VEASWDLARRRRRRIAALLLAPVLGCLACEGILRWLLFSDSALAERWGGSFRDAGLYVSTVDCDDYHELRYLFSPRERLGFEAPHAELGWVGPAFARDDLRHADEERLGGRRPVLLFGSSYAACCYKGACFEELLEASELGRDHCLLNYGVQAYGLDQAQLLLSKVVPRAAPLDPVVVLALVVDGDLRRSMVSFFAAPKPRYVREADELRLELPDERDPIAYLERHPPGISSYLWRYVAYGTGLLRGPSDARSELERRRRQECREVNHRILGQVHAELDALGLEHFVLLFYSRRSFPPVGGPSSDEQPLLEFLHDAGIPFVDARRFIEEEVGVSAGRLDELFLQDGIGKGHPSERGTEVLFQALELGLQRRYD
jgi:hypothetical protein